MELKLKAEKFEKLQVLFIEEIIERVRLKLLEGGVKDQQLEDLTASIAFSIASVIDDTSKIESNGIEVRPYLTFREDDDEVIHCGENSEMHEYVMGIMKKLFKH